MCPRSVAALVVIVASSQISLQGPEVTKLSEYADQLKAKLRELKGLEDIDSTLSVRKPELQVLIDRDRASDLDIPASTIANTLGVLVGGQIVSTYKGYGTI